METKERYDQSKIDKLVHYLEFYSQMGDPIVYEILVDGVSAVKRTTDTSHFQSFRSYVTSDTKTIVILLYDVIHKTTDKRTFHFPKPSEGCFIARQLKELRELLNENKALRQERAELEFEIARWKKRFGIDPSVGRSALHQN